MNQLSINSLTRPVPLRIAQVRDRRAVPFCSVALGLLVVFGLPLQTLAQPGSLDTAFNQGIGPNGEVKAIALQADEKIIVGGGFTRVNDLSLRRLARLNPDGSVDLTFNPAPIFDYPVHAVALDNTGKIVVASEFIADNNRGVVRLNPDGSVDPQFKSRGAFIVHALLVQPDGRIVTGGREGVSRLNPDGSNDTNFQPALLKGPRDTGTPVEVSALALQQDGKLIVGGAFTNVAGQTRNGVARLNSDGTLDETFVPEIDNYVTFFSGSFIKSLAIQSDGRILVVGGKFVRLHPNGARDHQFLTPAEFTVALALQADDKILLGYYGIYRLNEDGTADKAFGGGSVKGSLSVLAVQTNGDILLGGSFTAVKSLPVTNLARVSGNVTTGPPVLIEGPRDQRIVAGQNVQFQVSTIANAERPSYQWFFNGAMLAGAVQASLILSNAGPAQAGEYWAVLSNRSGMITSSIARLTVITSFAPGLMDVISTEPLNGEVYSLALQSDHKVLAAGAFTAAGGLPYKHVLRLDRDGSLDSSFKPDAAISEGTGTRARKVMSKPDGSVYVALQDAPRPLNLFPTSGTIVRLNSTGALDPSFHPDLGFAPESFTFQADGKIMVVGRSGPRMSLLYRHAKRFLPDGTRDTTFAYPSGSEPGNIFDVKVTADGKVLLAGHGWLGVSGAVVRLKSDGTPDPFEIVSGSAVVLELEPDGDMLIGSSAQPFEVMLRRLKPDGKLDPTFREVKPKDVFGTVRSIVILPDGKILIGGDFAGINGFSRKGIARLHSDGSVDPSFDLGEGINGFLNVVLPIDEGIFVFGGSFTSVSSVPAFNLAWGYERRLFWPKIENQSFQVFTPTAKGRSYTLQFTTNLGAPDWTNVSSVPGDGTVRKLTQPGPGTPGFYRTRIELAPN